MRGKARVGKKGKEVGRRAIEHFQKKPLEGYVPLSHTERRRIFGGTRKRSRTLRSGRIGRIRVGKC